MGSIVLSPQVASADVDGELVFSNVGDARHVAPSEVMFTLNEPIAPATSTSPPAEVGRAVDDEFAGNPVGAAVIMDVLANDDASLRDLVAAGGRWPWFVDPVDGRRNNPIVVPGEGAWGFHDWGDGPRAYFRPEPGFAVSPTPQRYSVSDADFTEQIATVTVGYEQDSPVKLEINPTRTSEPTRQLGDVTYDLTLSNAGAEPMSGVEVHVDNGGGPGYVVGAATGPTIIRGDDDGVLAAGEQWLYQASIARTGSETEFSIIVDLTGTTTLWFTVRDAPFDIAWGALLSALDISIETTGTAVAAGETVGWTVSVTNATDYPFRAIELVASLSPHDVVPGNTDPAGPPDDDGDGDALLAPGEVWNWNLRSVAGIEDRWFAAEAHGDVVGLPDESDTRYGAFASVAFDPVPPTTNGDPVSPTTPGTLPPTGAMNTVLLTWAGALMAAGVIVVGLRGRSRLLRQARMVTGPSRPSGERTTERHARRRQGL